MKTKILIYLILLLVLTACKNYSTDLPIEDKTNIYYNEIKNSLDKNNANNIKIIMTKKGKQKEELILYSYYSDINKSIIMGIKSAKWNSNGVEFVDLTQQICQPLPISFGSILQENNNEKRMITYGIINDNKIKSVKLIYTDKISIEEEFNGTGFIIIRNNYFDGITQIIASNKNSNEVYKFPDK